MESPGSVWNAAVEARMFLTSVDASVPSGPRIYKIEFYTA